MGDEDRVEGIERPARVQHDSEHYEPAEKSS